MWTLKSAKDTIIEIEHISQKIRVRFTRYKSFPGDWKLWLNHIDSIDEFRSLIQFAAPLLKDKGCVNILFIYPSKTKRQYYQRLIHRDIDKTGFVHYFTKRNSSLDLKTFDCKSKVMEDVRIIRWLDEYTKNNTHELESVYMVEFDSDFVVRKQGRWDEKIPDFKEFCDRFTSGSADLDSLHVAYIDANPVGLTYSWVDKDETGIFFTGVHPSYTGRGIATALKIRLANHLKSRCFDYLTTNNRVSNNAILNTNDKLGFEVLGEEIFYCYKVDVN